MAWLLVSQTEHMASPWRVDRGGVLSVDPAPGVFDGSGESEVGGRVTVHPADQPDPLLGRGGVLHHVDEIGGNRGGLLLGLDRGLLLLDLNRWLSHHLALGVAAVLGLEAHLAGVAVVRSAADHLSAERDDVVLTQVDLGSGERVNLVHIGLSRFRCRLVPTSQTLPGSSSLV